MVLAALKKSQDREETGQGKEIVEEAIGGGEVVQIDKCVAIRAGKELSRGVHLPILDEVQGDSGDGTREEGPFHPRP